MINGEVLFLCLKRISIEMSKSRIVVKAIKAIQLLFVTVQSFLRFLG